MFVRYSKKFCDCICASNVAAGSLAYHDARRFMEQKSVVGRGAELRVIVVFNVGSGGPAECGRLVNRGNLDSCM